MMSIEVALTNQRGCPSKQNEGLAVGPSGPHISLAHLPPSLISSPSYQLITSSGTFPQHL